MEIPMARLNDKLGLISSDRYVDNLRLVVLSEDRDP